MTESDHPRDTLHSTISDMENDVYDVRRWADVLIVMSASSHAAEPTTLSVLGNALRDVGIALEDQFKRAHELARPKA